MARVDSEHLPEHGYVVVEQVVESRYVSALLDVLREHAGFDVRDPATWAVERAFPPIWGHQAQWDVRQHPDVYAVWAQLYGREDLRVSQDGTSVKPPEKVATGDAGRALPIHWDQDPLDPRTVYQGVLYLTDVAPDQGAFCCVPALFRDRAGWCRRHPGASRRDIDTEGHEVVAVPGRAGDLVAFDARLPHGNGRNLADRPRVVQYVLMFPAGHYGDRAEDHAELYRSGRANPAWRTRPGWDSVQPWPPARLTALGRRLAGVERWPGEEDPDAAPPLAPPIEGRSVRLRAPRADDVDARLAADATLTHAEAEEWLALRAGFPWQWVIERANMAVGEIRLVDYDRETREAAIACDLFGDHDGAAARDACETLAAWARGEPLRLRHLRTPAVAAGG